MQGKRSTRAEAAAAGLAVAERAESQEACFLAGDDYRAFLERQGLDRRPGADRRRNGASSSVATTASGATRPGSGAGSGSRRRSRVYALRSDATTNTLVVGPRSALEVSQVDVRGRLYLPVERAEVEAALPVGRRAGSSSSATAEGFRSRASRSPRSAVAPGQVAVLYDDDAVVGAGVIVAATG